jgi:hypothetical protein
MQPQRDTLGDGGRSDTFSHHGRVTLGQFEGEFSSVVGLDFARQHLALTSIAPRSCRSLRMSTPIFCDRRTNQVASGPLKKSDPARATIMQRTNLVQAWATSG